MVRKQIVWSVDKSVEPVLWKEITLDEETDCLYFQMNYPKEFAYGSFFLVFDSEGHMRLQKLLGYGEQALCIGDTPLKTTVGGVPGKLKQGRYQIVLGIFTEYLERYKGVFPVEVVMQVDTQNGDITQPIGEYSWMQSDKTATIVFDGYDWNGYRQSEERWYKGDFHTHTRLSDGKQTVKDAMTLAEQMHMDFYVPTEHNLVHTGWVKTSVMAVPGVEITTNLGHCNFFGITQYPGHIMDIMRNMNEPCLEENLLAQIQEAVDNDWLVSINHPFLHIWKWTCRSVRLKDISCMELINDPTYEYAKEANDKAIAFLDLLRTDGYRITGIGGSDAHNLPKERYPGADLPSVAGDPAKLVFAKGLSPYTLLEGVKKGHVCITRYCEIEISAKGFWKTYLPGDTLERETVTIDIQMKGMRTEPELYAVWYREEEDDGKIYKIHVPSVESKEEYYRWEYYYSVVGKGWQWIRFEVRDKDGNFMAYVNPFYFGKKEHTWQQFGEVLDRVEQTDAD